MISTTFPGKGPVTIKDFVERNEEELPCSVPDGLCHGIDVEDEFSYSRLTIDLDSTAEDAPPTAENQSTPKQPMKRLRKISESSEDSNRTVIPLFTSDEEPEKEPQQKQSPNKYTQTDSDLANSHLEDIFCMGCDLWIFVEKKDLEKLRFCTGCGRKFYE